MLFSFKRPTLLAIFLALLAVTQCLGVPVGTGSTPPPSPDIKPLTPPNQGSSSVSQPGAPKKPVVEAPPAVLNYLVAWMKRSETRLRAASATKGGIESWVQFDFEVEFKVRQGINVEKDIEVREIRVFGKGLQAADWVFPPGNGKPGLIIELKVESAAQHGARFADLVVKDQEKISSELKVGYEKYDRAVLAIAWERNTHTKLLEKNMKPVEGVEIKFETRPNDIIRLYQWTDGSGGIMDTGGASSIAPGPATDLALRPASSKPNSEIPQIPGGQTPSAGTTQTPVGESQTPSKASSKTKGVLNKLKFGKKKGPQPPPPPGGAGGPADTPPT